MTLVKLKGAAPKTWDSLLDSWFNDFPVKGNDNFWQPFSKVPVNIHETKDAYHLEVNVPGLKKEDIKISVDKDLLTISYEKKEETNNEDYKTIRREFSYEGFTRSFSLSDKINADAIQAKYEDGILKVHVPKKEEVQVSAKQISVG
ncbi:MAG: Hsp20/alpha crystallin family protein [Chitinophagaceae bacterium]|nr:Hsp20/alpha crystallin family protein [Chitinophagaceae bacterium]MCW5926274.1 Hsp20/alpha crystallin family protein [Chitinophagaceae bacterium]